MQTVEEKQVPAQASQTPLTEAWIERLGVRPRTLAWVGAVAVVLAVWVFLLWAFRGQPGDDPYITYRYAHNLATGQGFVFNPGERVQSTTTPLFTLLLAGAALLGANIPPFGYLLSLLCLLAFGVCCVRLVALRASPWLGLAVVGLTFASQVTAFGLGGEMPLLMALSWGCWLAAARSRWVLCALLAGLAAVTRGDAVLVGASVAAVFVWTHRRVPLRAWPWPAVGVYALTAAPWYLFAWFYFGSPLPATFGAKLAQGSTPGAPSFLDGLWLFWFRALGDFSWLGYPLLVVLAIGLVVLVRAGTPLAPVWVWAGLLVGSFTLLHLPRYPWYYSPVVPVAMLALVLGGEQIGRFAGRRRLRPHIAGAVAALTLALFVGGAYLYNDVLSARPEPSVRSQLYIGAGKWLSENLPSGASLGADEVGLVGYYSGHRIIDFVGLIQPEVAPHRASRDFLWVLQTYRPDYIFALPGWTLSIGLDPWVKANYTPIRTFEGYGEENGRPLVATLLKRTP